MLWWRRLSCSSCLRLTYVPFSTLCLTALSCPRLLHNNCFIYQCWEDWHVTDSRSILYQCRVKQWSSRYDDTIALFQSENSFYFSKRNSWENWWWLLVPKLNDINLQETQKSTETHKCVSTCFPHFGTLFGLTKDAAEIVLVEMGLLTMLKGKNIRVCSQG